MTTPDQPGWYDDPNDPKAQRYWDGHDWTPQRQRKSIRREALTPATLPPPPNLPPPQPSLPNLPPPPSPGQPPQSPPPSQPFGSSPKRRRPAITIAGWNRNQSIALLAVVLIVAAGGVLLYRHASSKPIGSELVLTAATDPGANAFMPPAASPPPTSTQLPPTLKPQGDGSAVETQPLPGDRDGLYGGTDNEAGADPDKMADFLDANPSQASAFVDALNSDPTVWWSGARRLAAGDIRAYLHELTPAVLRLDTRITDHRFDGTHPTALQSVFQGGTALLVDAHGVPRVRGLSGNPLTGPIALRGAPKLVGAPWPGYHPGALAEVRPSTADIKNFVLVDVVKGQPFNRPAGTTGVSDTPHTEPVASPQPAPDTSASDTNAPPTKEEARQHDFSGSYLFHLLSVTCEPVACTGQLQPDYTETVTQQGNTLNIEGFTGPLNADGSFTLTRPYGELRGVIGTEGGRTVIHDAVQKQGSSAGPSVSIETFTATRQ
jgi:hypothetical protein